jgi:hypothetical protein
MGHKGPVLRPRCNGPGRARTQIRHVSCSHLHCHSSGTKFSVCTVLLPRSLPFFLVLIVGKVIMTEWPKYQLILFKMFYFIGQFFRSFLFSPILQTFMIFSEMLTGIIFHVLQHLTLMIWNSLYRCFLFQADSCRAIVCGTGSGKANGFNAAEISV